MGALTDDMKRVVREQQLGFIATVGSDGAPNLSPKGSTKVLDDDHLIFADIASPGTVANLRADPRLEINVVDPIVRKGYRFKGVAEIFAEGERFDALLDWLRANGTASQVQTVVVMRVTWCAPLTSPAYDDGRSEATVVAHWEAKRDELRKARSN